MINHPTHTFGTVDDCIRCLDCEVLFGGSKSGTECPAHRERIEITSVDEIKTDSDAYIGCRHNIARCEETIPWCTDCHAYIDQQTGKPYVARRARDNFEEAVELRYDRDTESFQYPEGY